MRSTGTGEITLTHESEKAQIANLLDLVETSKEDIINVSLEKDLLKKIVRNYHYFLKEMDTKTVCPKR